MKRLFFLFLFLFFPQLSDARFFTGFGIKAGVAAANQSWEYSGQAAGIDIGAKTRWGFDVGVYTEFARIYPLSFQTEVHYIQKGFRIENTRIGESGDTLGLLSQEPRVDYIAIPILAKAMPKFGSVSPYLLAGLRVDFLIGKRPESFELVFDSLKKIGTGAEFGVGVELLRLFPARVFTELRYSPSFSSAFKGEFLKVKNDSFEILLGVGF